MSATETIDQLKAEGFKVRVRHLRRCADWRGRILEIFLPLHEIRTEGLELLPTGGETRVSIEYPDGLSGVNAVAACSVQDNFCRRTGLELAVSRALDLLGRSS